MARRRSSRRQGVRGRPNYVWLSVAGQTDLTVAASTIGISEPLLLPTDWQTVDATETQCTLCHLVYTHTIVGLSVASTYSWLGQYAINKASAETDTTINVLSLSDPVSFSNFFLRYDECLHWGQFTAMPYNAAAIADNVRVGGGSSTGIPENVVNLNTRRKLKGNDCLRVSWSGFVPSTTATYDAFWFVRALVRIGLK